MDRQPNDRLAALLEASGWSHAGLAKRVNDDCRRRGFPRFYSATSVTNWLSGMVPTVPVPEVLAQLFTERLGRRVKPSDLGCPESVPLDLALTWEPTTRAAVGTVAELWRVDMERRSLLLGSAWIASAFATPTREWLLHWLEDDTAHVGSRRVGAAEVDVVWSMCHAFAVADQRLGGGYARTTLVHYVNQVVLPLLDGTYPERVGRSLLAATARLCDLAGWTAYDSDAQGLGQRHYIQALRLAQASGDRAIGALILSDMAQQAHHLGNPAEACSLARAGQRAAEESGSSLTLARCFAMEALAHARHGDERQCGRAMTRAEQAFERTRPDDEPPWIRSFTLASLQWEFAAAAAELGRSGDVQTFAPAVLAGSVERERRRLLMTATLASSYLPSGDRGSVTADVERACATLEEGVPLVQALTSRRGVEAVNRVRRQLAPFRDQQAVRELEATFTPLIGAAA